MFSDTVKQVPCIICHRMTWIDTKIQNQEDAICTAIDCQGKAKNMTGVQHGRYVEILKEKGML